MTLQRTLLPSVAQAGGSSPAEAAADRSVPRQRRRKGDLSRDGRGRLIAAPAILSYGFRPFFLGAALYAAAGIPAWLWMYRGGWAPNGPFPGMAWHVHEMIFGYLGAVLAGFILTAIPNWTGRLPLSGLPLAGLVALWALGRIASGFIGMPLLAMALDLAFPVALMAAAWREVAAGRNWRNAPVVLLLTLFGLANGLHHLEMMGSVPEGLAMRLGLGIIAMLIALIGGRLVPSFTHNWLAKQAGPGLPVPFGGLDKLALLVTAGAVLLWVWQPALEATGAALVLAGGLLAVRLARWRGLATLGEPILFVLHLGYAWLAISLACLGASVLIGDALHASVAIHALTAGAVGTMTLAVMTRATLGHTGRAIEADAWTVAIYAAVTLAALLRVAAPFVPSLHMELLVLAGGAWSLAFAIFLLRYGPMLCRPRLGG